ncbi:bifunctional GlmU protein [Achlya hypogyna]|uniref:Bifunctional GlmU protein n=1 Tax=Achlya hypogyna TaxID=1202772 RepID=A0A1V9YDZ0_ACHHY|nr:bifunctional GlmU protein [Achlya hypogyna]
MAVPTSVVVGVSALTVLALYYLQATRRESPALQPRKRKQLLRLQALAAGEVPLALRPSFYFNVPFQHDAIFDAATNVFAVLDRLHEYIEVWLAAHVPSRPPTAMLCKGTDGATVLVSSQEDALADATVFNYSGRDDRCLVLEDGVRVMGGVFDVSEGSIYLGRNTVVEPNVFIKGPVIIGEGCTVRHGAYLRGDVLLGDHVVLRAEVKHALIMDHAELCHPGYCGDSLCGYKSHFANQVSTANLTLMVPTGGTGVCIEVNGTVYDTGRRKVGVVLGDNSQLGCNVATDPCTLIGPNTNVYALTRLNKGLYGPNEIIKNKPMEKGVVERAPLRQ